MGNRLALVRQKAFNDCGVAALKMVADHFLPEPVTYEELSMLCKLSVKGMSVHSLCDAAFLLGLRAIAIKCNIDDLQNSLQFPVIAYVNENHFVVISGFSGGSIVVLDPSKGKITYSIKAFCTDWYAKNEDHGVILVMDKAEGIAPYQRSRRKGQKQCQKQVVVLLTHFFNDSIRKQCMKISEELSHGQYELILLYHNRSENHAHIPTEIPHDVVSEADLTTLGYNQMESTLLPGSTHFPGMSFYLLHPYYAHYWFVEYDVVFTGNWLTLMEDCRKNLADYDFLSCHIERYDEERNGLWYWWRQGNRAGVTYKNCIKGFNPICRYSNRALTCLDQYMKQGYSAHSEVMITTCLYHHGMKIGDIGGQGEFVPKGWKNRYYLAGEGVNNGTMRYRPVYTREEIEKTGLKNKLFHPLKE